MTLASRYYLGASCLGRLFDPLLAYVLRQSSQLGIEHGPDAPHREHC